MHADPSRERLATSATVVTVIRTVGSAILSALAAYQGGGWCWVRCEAWVSGGVVGQRDLTMVEGADHLPAPTTLRARTRNL